MTERTRADQTDGSTLSAEESSLFRRSVGSVKPLKDDRADAEPTRRPKPMPKRRERLAEELEQLEELDSPFEPIVEANEVLTFARPGVAGRTVKKLRRGQFPIEAELDLHGMTAAGAYAALERFLAHAARDHLRHVRVIHGKGFGSDSGRPVIKSKVNLWLRIDPRVAAYCSAPPAHGGTGALNVLLKASARKT